MRIRSDDPHGLARSTRMCTGYTDAHGLTRTYTEYTESHGVHGVAQSTQTHTVTDWNEVAQSAALRGPNLEAAPPCRPPIFLFFYPTLMISWQGDHLQQG